MRRTASSLVVAALEDEGVPFSFGIPGTHNIELYDALAASRLIRPVLVTDEQSASFMADGFWRASGMLGCVNVVPGAGLAHALSGIAEAFLDNVPMLVLGCGIRRDSGHAFQLHDIDQQAMVGPVVKGSHLVERSADVYQTLREACALAREPPAGPVFVEIPANLYMLAEEVDRDYRGSFKSTPPDPGPSQSLRSGVERAAELLAVGRRPLLYVGAGAAGASALLVELAERLESPVATTIQGKGVFPEEHPLFLWPGFGRSAPKFVREIVSTCDVTLAMGCRFGEVATGSYGVDPPSPLIHVDADPTALNRNFKATVGVVADASDFVYFLLGALADESKGRIPGQGGIGSSQQLRQAISEGHRSVFQDWMEDVGGDGVTPAHLLQCLQTTLGPEAIFTTDSGNGTFLAMECLRLSGPGRFLAPVDFSCMGYSVPAAVGAKLGRPEAPVVALAGDGAFLMTGLELLTAAREGLGVMVFLLRDGELAQIAQFQDTVLNRRVASTLPGFDPKGLANGMGVPFLHLGCDEDVENVVAEASALAASERPVLVDVEIDYSQKTYFTRGVVQTNLHRLPLRDQVRFIGRALKRKVMGEGSSS